MGKRAEGERILKSINLIGEDDRIGCEPKRCRRLNREGPGDGMLCSGQIAAAMADAAKEVRTSPIQTSDGSPIPPEVQERVNGVLGDVLFEKAMMAGMAAENCDLRVSGQTALVDASEVAAQIASIRAASSDVCDNPVFTKDGESFS